MYGNRSQNSRRVCPDGQGVRRLHHGLTDNLYLLSSTITYNPNWQTEICKWNVVSLMMMMMMMMWCDDDVVMMNTMMMWWWWWRQRQWFYNDDPWRDNVFQLIARFGFSLWIPDYCICLSVFMICVCVESDWCESEVREIISFLFSIFSIFCK